MLVGLVLFVVGARVDEVVTLVSERTVPRPVATVGDAPAWSVTDGRLRADAAALLILIPSARRIA